MTGSVWNVVEREDAGTVEQIVVRVRETYRCALLLHFGLLGNRLWQRKGVLGFCACDSTMRTDCCLVIERTSERAIDGQSNKENNGRAGV